jgi:hypothetical protein
MQYQEREKAVSKNMYLVWTIVKGAHFPATPSLSHFTLRPHPKPVTKLTIIPAKQILIKEMFKKDVSTNAMCRTWTDLFLPDGQITLALAGLYNSDWASGDSSVVASTD